LFAHCPLTFSSTDSHTSCCMFLLPTSVPSPEGLLLLIALQGLKKVTTTGTLHEPHSHRHAQTHLSRRETCLWFLWLSRITSTAVSQNTQMRLMDSSIQNWWSP
jgi:hypothetical protein